MTCKFPECETCEFNDSDVCNVCEDADQYEEHEETDWEYKSDDGDQDDEYGGLKPLDFEEAA